MKLTGNTILITGGASGIGLALATRFLERGNTVIISGRREHKLAEARSTNPEFRTIEADVATPEGRKKLAELAIAEFPDLNVVVNNAGIQRSIDLTQPEDWKLTRSEIATNLDAPIHLSQLFYSHLSAKNSAAILNVTSGLSFVPLANVPVYCATKAALHSFTQSLRWQLKSTSIEVIEIAPPAVDTDLQAPGLHTFGINVDEFADAVFEGLEKGENEIAYGTALLASKASRSDLDNIFTYLNAAPPI